VLRSRMRCTAAVRRVKTRTPSPLFVHPTPSAHHNQLESMRSLHHHALPRDRSHLSGDGFGRRRWWRKHVFPRPRYPREAPPRHCARRRPPTAHTIAHLRQLCVRLGRLFQRALVTPHRCLPIREALRLTCTSTSYTAQCPSMSATPWLTQCTHYRCIQRTLFNHGAAPCVLQV
jgi:hypothetical protein